MARGTGQTHRQLEETVAALGNDGRVLFVTAGASVDYAVEIAQKILAWRGIVATYEKTTRRIVFRDRPFAELAFISEDDFDERQYRGTGRRVVVDHAARVFRVAI